MSAKPTHSPYDICACAQLRKATRTVTQHYDAALRPTGLRITQYSILKTLAATGPVAVSDLAERLVLERTGLTRNLKPLKRDGLVEIVPGADSRVRVVHLTGRGRETIARADPYWREAQNRIVDALGADQASQLLGGLSDIRQAVQD